MTDETATAMARHWAERRSCGRTPEFSVDDFVELCRWVCDRVAELRRVARGVGATTTDDDLHEMLVDTLGIEARWAAELLRESRRRVPTRVSFTVEDDEDAERIGSMLAALGYSPQRQPTDLVAQRNTAIRALDMIAPRPWFAHCEAVDQDDDAEWSIEDNNGDVVARRWGPREPSCGSWARSEVAAVNALPYPDSKDTQ